MVWQGSLPGGKGEARQRTCVGHEVNMPCVIGEAIMRRA
jgi:hypothetical protein